MYHTILLYMIWRYSNWKMLECGFYGVYYTIIISKKLSEFLMMTPMKKEGKEEKKDIENDWFLC
jgi:hypothetical protein